MQKSNCNCTCKWLTRSQRAGLVYLFFIINLTECLSFRSYSMCRGFDRRDTPLICPFSRDPSNVAVFNRLRDSIHHIERLSSWVRHIRSGVEAMIPWLRAPDTRSGRVKYLDTCLALVSEDAMAVWLERQANVDLSQWGRGKAKHVADLLKEVRAPPNFLADLTAQADRNVLAHARRILRILHRLIDWRPWRARHFAHSTPS